MSKPSSTSSSEALRTTLGASLPLLAVLGLFGALELGFRAHYLGADVALRPWRYSAVRLLQSELVVPDADPRIGWRLRPGVRSTYRGGRFSTNSLGFRDREIPDTSRGGRTRIAVLGGSITMGAGVADGEDWAHRLGARLERSAPRRFEVFNFAVGGYRIGQIAAAYARDVAVLAPDLVVVPVYWAESRVVEPPHARSLHEARPARLDLRGRLAHAFLYHALRFWVRQWGREWLSRDWRTRGLPPHPYPPGSRTALELLRDFAEQRRAEGTPVALVELPAVRRVSWDTVEALRAQARPWLDAGPGVALLETQETVGLHLRLADRCYPGDRHPSAAVHDHWAAAIHAALAGHAAELGLPAGTFSGVTQR